MPDGPIVLAHVPAFRLGVLQLQPPLLQALRDGRSETLEPRVMQVLVALALADGGIVTHDELIARCWDGRIVGEGAIHRVMSRIRHLASGLGAGSFQLENIPRVGYRIVEVDPPPTDEDDRTPGGVTAATADPVRKRRISLLAALGGVLALLATSIWWPHPPAQSVSGASGTPLLAVLPFRMLSPGPRDELMELGMADTLIARLSRSDAIRVQALASARQLASTTPDALQVARSLEADYVVDGTIQAHQGRIRVAARLLAVPEGTVAWSDTFDADAGNVFQLQGTIADALANALALRLPAPAAAMRPACDGSDPELYRMHMQARVLLNEPTPPRLDEAIGILEEVFARDPHCARALAGKAFAWRTRSIVADTDPRVAFRIVNAAIDQALAIDPDLAEAHSERGWYLLWHGWQWEASEQSFRHAIALNPSLSEARRGYAHLLSTLGRHDQALEQAERALRVDPNSGLCNVQRGQFLLSTGRVDEAMEQFEHTLKVRPGFWIALLARGSVAVARGDHASGIADLEKAIETSHGSSIALSNLGGALALAGQPRRAEAILRQLQERAAQRYVPPSVIAQLALQLGKRDLALDQYEEAYRARDMMLTFLGTRSRDTHPLREEPRFIALLQRLDLYDPPAMADAPVEPGTP